MWKFSLLLSIFHVLSASVLAGRHHQSAHRDFRDRYGPIVTAAASQHVSQVMGGYHYPVPASTNVNPQIQVAPKTVSEMMMMITTEVPTTTSAPATTMLPITSMRPKVVQVPASKVTKSSPSAVLAQASMSSVTQASVGQASLETSSAEENARQLHVHHSPQVQTIDVACGREKMTVRVAFDQEFNGVIYAKGHYSDPNCRFTAANQGQKVYQFEMVVGQCGVAYIDSGLTSGGQAHVEGMLVIILEPGVQEAWDEARRIRCLWEGNIDQTVTYPLSLNMLESQTLTFSGDTASANLEIQSGRGPRAPSVQGLVRVGEMLTAVVTVQGDPDFDLLVKNCVATDGTPTNRIILSDNRGCAVKTKLMGGWKKQKNSGSISAYAYLSAFKFPDIMDLFLECTVSLCKSTCEECPEYLELHVPNHGHDHEDELPAPTAASGSQEQPSKIEVRTAARITKRSAEERFNDRYNETVSAESLRLRKVVRVVGPDDLPELAFRDSSSVYGHACANDCFSAFGIVAAVGTTFTMMLTLLGIFGIFRRHLRNEKC
ncbi:uncharacterized protein LOC110847138 isoform X1 [Folsomia candida]|uniref:uncharacterized protein LOC110847138 isoform X1 n=2 Tax=Folsomia candida TaxID=158441 RepID=UPI000B8F5D2F|nr:uncharacterized protein LOC110847138 isoform X1 [Folsomia candida]